MVITGDLNNLQREMKFEWKIKDFLMLGSEPDEQYESPQFSFYGVSWEIYIYPYGQKNHPPVEYIGVYLRSISLFKPVKVDVAFSFKNVKEILHDFKQNGTHLFKKKEGYGWHKFILRSDLIKRKSELLPSETLTVICTIKISEISITAKNIFLDASAQTDEVTAQNTFLDASAQANEETGVWKLQQHLREISLNGDISDVTLKVEDQEFKSHRCILAARSPVFLAMMKNKMKESVTGVIDIEDVDSKTFSYFLSYLYTGSTEDLTPENVAKVYTTADKYQVQVLKESCLEYMLVNVSVENFCDIFILSVQHNEKKLKETCIRYFGKHLLDIIKSCKWQSFLCENTIIGNELFIKHAECNKNML